MGPDERRISATSAGSSDETDHAHAHHQHHQHEPVDPRVKLKLDQLNQLTYTINQLEKRIEECNQSFQNYLSESSDELKLLATRVGTRSVAEARPYYEARDLVSATQTACQKAAMEYERQSEAHQLAREYMTITESKSHNQINHRGGASFDAAWQTMLNDATIKLLDTERKRDKCQEDHEACLKRFAEAESSAAVLEQQHKNSIRRAKPYFEFSAKVHASLEERKTEIEQLNALLVEAKERYADTMRDLEDISEEIHEIRRNNRLRKSISATQLKKIASDSSVQDDSSDIVSLPQVDQDMQPHGASSCPSGAQGSSPSDSSSSSSSSGSNSNSNKLASRRERSNSLPDVAECHISEPPTGATTNAVKSVTTDGDGPPVGPPAKPSRKLSASPDSEIESVTDSTTTTTTTTHL